MFINGKYVGNHVGGYSAFVFDITGDVIFGKINNILVRVNNAENLDVIPLVGDFNIYGGIYRNVKLIVTDKMCISPLKYSSLGVFLKQDTVCDDFARVKASVTLSNRTKNDKEISLVLDILNKDKSVKKIVKEFMIHAMSDSTCDVSFVLKKPRLWNGRKDPFLYSVKTSISGSKGIFDQVITSMGLRYFRVDPEKGFFLNGKHLQINGVCRHQDRSEIGNALRLSHEEEDLKLILEMGANAVRLSHYPHSSNFYDLMDKHGIIVWSEIPFVGPGGYGDKGFIDSDTFKKNTREQLKEMIYQHYNHPSICFWGLFNELKEEGDNPVDFIKELDALVKNEDDSRLTTAASNQEGNLNYITDLIAWNKYYGWYGSNINELAKWLDKTHAENPHLCIGISEYGAGASIYHQQDSLKQPIPNSWWHPENWQTYYHIKNWQIISERPFVWGSFIWNMFDFGAAHRREGDRPGINDKGLVTFDRKIKKDAFYFYKANWNKSVPVLYISGKRNTERSSKYQTFVVFTNLDEVELYVNGISLGKKKADKYSIVKWDNVECQYGINIVKALGKSKIVDSLIFNISEK